mgnify:FL=1|jgi:hypothetical protein|tara:strand:+ start:313 stop:624 length:312 start_codon:yes stop_codon:yes gene_type:complete
MDDNSDIIESLLGITDSKDKVIMSIEEGNEDSDFTVRVFDLSDDTEQETLIKEIAYGILSMLHDEDKLNSIRNLGKYEFAINKQNKSSPVQHIGDNVVAFVPR